MGAQSITELAFPDGTSRFSLHWGSPQYQFPNMAEYVFETWTHDLGWRLAGYREYADQARTGLPTEVFTGKVHGDVEHHYRYEFDRNGQVVFRYSSRTFGQVGPRKWRVEHEGAGRLDLYRAALHWRADLRGNIYRRSLRGWGPGRIEDYDLDLACCTFRIASEMRSGAADSANSAAFHAAHDCRDTGCGTPLLFDAEMAAQSLPGTNEPGSK
ncbi:hypothetical protein [Glycomyces tenuis]|uniref:hypothetical protein n=1 Tax=Glycomyces tenuis TaxID=58116 RepID=UPI0003FDF8DB|nr:hypothetical protein [Glycomyces tenuis]